MYVTETFYNDEYSGETTESEVLLRLIKRAERDIDRVTRYRITDFDSQPAKIQELVRFAVCSQVEFLVNNGETSSTFTNDQPFSIGSYSEGNSQSKLSESKPLLADSTMDYLYPTGYLYNGVDYY